VKKLIGTKFKTGRSLLVLLPLHLNHQQIWFLLEQTLLLEFLMRIYIHIIG